MDCSTPGFPIHYQLLGLTQTHVHWVSDAIQPSHPLLSPSPSTLQSFLASGSFPMSQFFSSGGQSIEISTSASVLPMNIQDLFPLELTGWILQSKELSRVFSNTTVQKHQFLVLILLYSPTLTSIHDYWKNHSFDQTDLCWPSNLLLFNILSRLVIAFLPRSKHLLISGLQSSFAVIFGAPKNKVCHSFHCFPTYLPWRDGTHDLYFLKAEF